MTCKPLIGINADYRSANRQTPAYCYVSAGYFESIKAAGGVPIVIPPLDDAESVCALLDGTATVAEVVQALLARPLKAESW